MQKFKRSTTEDNLVQGQSVCTLKAFIVPAGYLKEGVQLQAAVTGVEIWCFKERWRVPCSLSHTHTHKHAHTHAYSHAHTHTHCLLPLCIHFLLLLSSQSSRGRSTTTPRALGTCQSWVCPRTLRWTRASQWHVPAPVFGPVGRKDKAQNVPRKNLNLVSVKRLIWTDSSLIIFVVLKDRCCIYHIISKSEFKLSIINLRLITWNSPLF